MFDDAGDLIETVDPTGVATVNVYDQAGHISTSGGGTNPGGFSYGDLTSTTITQANNVVESTTGNFGAAPARTSNYYYTDAAHPGDLTKTVDANNHTTQAGFDSYGDLTSTTNGAGDVTRYGYDTGTGRRTSTVDGNGTAAGVNPGCTPPATGCTSIAYNAWGQVTQTTDPLGHTTTASYDPDGQVATSTDANNRTTTYTADAADRIVTVTQPDGTYATTDYNDDGTVADTVDALTAKTVYGYDGQGRLVSTTDPDNRTTSTGVDPAGLVTSAVDATGRTTTLAHDPAGRVTTIGYSDGTTPTVTLGYDPDGRRTSMTDGTGTSTWAYDAFGQLTTATTPSGTVGYGYDPVGNTTSISYPGQATPVTRGFDAADRLTSVKDFAGNSTSFGYDHDSAVTTTGYPGGSVVTNAYDPAEQLTGTTAAHAGSTLAAYTYGRDNAGQVNAQTIAGTTQTFSYSPREQLAGGVTGGTTTGYAYDPANHPTQVGTTTATFDPAGQECWSTTATVSNPTCGSKPAGATGYTFDGNGQRTATTPATGTASSYGYDQAGRLTTATTPNGSGSYTYNGLGQRVGKTVAGTTTTGDVWDNNAVPNLLVDGTTRILYGPDNQPIEQTGTAGTTFFVHDQIGSTRTLLTTSGTVAGGYDYTPYGVPTHSGTATTNLQFSGQYTDPETGLIYLRALLRPHHPGGRQSRFMR